MAEQSLNPTDKAIAALEAVSNNAVCHPKFAAGEYLLDKSSMRLVEESLAALKQQPEAMRSADQCVDEFAQEYLLFWFQKVVPELLQQSAICDKESGDMTIPQFELSQSTADTMRALFKEWHGRIQRDAIASVALKVGGDVTKFIERKLGSYDRNGVFATWATDLVKDLQSAGWIITSKSYGDTSFAQGIEAAAKEIENRGDGFANGYYFACKIRALKPTDTAQGETNAK